MAPAAHVTARVVVVELRDDGVASTILAQLQLRLVQKVAVVGLLVGRKVGIGE